MLNWENPRVIEENKEKGHVMAMPYNDLNTQGRCPNKILLNGEWAFKYKMGHNEYGPSNPMMVPSLWQLKGYGKPYYLAFDYPPALSKKKKEIPKINHNLQEYGLYKRSFDVPKNWLDDRVYLHFEGVKSAFEVSINNHKVGYSQGSMTPAEFAIKPYLKESDNTITVEVYRYSDGTYLEDQDMWFLSGIFRDVYLYREKEVCLRDFHISSKFDDHYSDATLAVEYEILGKSHYQLEVHIDDYVFVIEDNKQKGSKSFQINGPKHWTAETPNLYEIKLVLKTDGEIQSVKSIEFGFRDIELKDTQILINGKKIQLKGVNRHDFDPESAWTVPDYRYDQDLTIMKQNNINAIRCSHYPNDLRFYEACNRYGFYVMDEADVETHGVRKKNVPGDNPKWKDAVVDRMERMVLRDRNYSCIFMWSLGNEAGFGANFAHMKQAALRLDQTRAFHYEGDYDISVSDVLSRMYTTPQILARIGRKEPIKIKPINNIMNQLFADDKPLKAEWYQNKPVILCEYAHAMENSLGNFKEYMDVFERYDNLAGGFIWDFVDQAIKVTQDNQVKYLYGGDFGEDKTHGYFCANGIVDCDRNPHPSLVEVKKGYQPIAVSKIDDIYTIKNKHSFLNLNHFDACIKLLRDGVVVKEDKTTIHLAPGESYDYPYKAYSFDQRMYILEFSFIRRHDEIWGGGGEEVAFEQFVLSPYHYQSGVSDTISYKITKNTIEMIDYEIDLKSGDITFGSIGTLKLNFWRAKTDNDRGLVNFDKKLSFLMNNKWQEATDNYALINYNIIEKSNKLIVMTEVKVKGFKRKLNRTYTFTKEHVIVELSGVPVRDLERFGQSLTCPKVAMPLKWFGRGPEENYLDRKSGSKIGLYEKVYSDYVHHYMRPQENSNRSDIHWFNYDKIHIEDVSGHGLSISCYPYSQKTLDDTEHIHDLVEADNLTLNIDHLQKGVGGDEPGSAALHEPYKLNKDKLYHYAFKIKVSK